MRREIAFQLGGAGGAEILPSLRPDIQTGLSDMPLQLWIDVGQQVDVRQHEVAGKIAKTVPRLVQASLVLPSLQSLTSAPSDRFRAPNRSAQLLAGLFQNHRGDLVGSVPGVLPGLHPRNANLRAHRTQIVVLNTDQCRNQDHNRRILD